MAQQANAKTAQGPGTAALWGGWALGAGAWALHLGISYGLVEWYCHTETGIAPGTIYWTLNGTTLFCVTLALLGIVLARRNTRRAKPQSAATEAGVERKRFMGQAGALLSLLFLGIILMQGVPNFFLGPCQ